MTREDAIRKVRACLRLAAESSGAPAPERETAQSMAGALMLAHGLSAQDIRAAAPAAPTPPAWTPEDIVIVVNLGNFFFGGGNGFRFSDATATTTSY